MINSLNATTIAQTALNMLIAVDKRVILSHIELVEMVNSVSREIVEYEVRRLKNTDVYKRLVKIDVIECLPISSEEYYTIDDMMRGALVVVTLESVTDITTEVIDRLERGNRFVECGHLLMAGIQEHIESIDNK